MQPHKEIKQVKKRKKISKLTKEIIVVSAICLFFLGIIHSFIFVEAFDGDTIDADISSKFGSFIGGYFGTIFALISAVLLYFTLRIEQKATAREKFENKFFGLIEIHKSNLSEIKIRKKSGKRVFVLMLREFRELLSIVKEIAKILNIPLNKRDSINLAYMSFFYGIGPNSSRILKAALIKFDKKLIEVLIKFLENEDLRKAIKKKRRLGFKPFGGHQSRLAHYFRHMYQTVKFVDGQKIEIEKYEYVKMLRAQLSNHEQALLFLNSISYLGETWKDEDLITNYELIKNLPKSFFDEETEIDVKSEYDIKFEWEEVEKSNKKKI
ncbi:MAG: hypothetical protein K1X86_03235 [Ignavibacteria bacterium]|nr:hypothetical protein [Ignavibacteria bacterium]